ncbi:MAG: dephospho-CoA kinase [Eubacteriales bacterium]|nr:dephospho-CoA kinase [Eubacteriales bacterium]
MSSIIIGIIGGIGSGKSAVSNYLIKRKEHVICADKAARQVVRQGEEGSIAIRRAFGDAFFYDDGALNRKKLAEHVFGDKDMLKMLNGILHPLIIEYIWGETERLDGRAFVDAPLLIQTGMHKKVDYVWLVTADMQKRIGRVMKRDGLSHIEVKRRIDNQMSDREMTAYADEIIDNSNGIGELHQKIDGLLNTKKYLR